MKENLGRCDHGGPRAPARKRKLATVGGVSTAPASASDQKTELKILGVLQVLPSLPAARIGEDSRQTLDWGRAKACSSFA